MKKHAIPLKRIRRQALGSLAAVIALAAVAAVLGCARLAPSRSYELASPEEPGPLYEQPAVTPEPTAPPEPMVRPDADTILLAKIMQAEDGVDWPDWAIMALGEVVLNRVASPEFPDTIEAVLLADNPVQYAPVHTAAWERTDPEARYIELAERLLSGERVLCDPRIVYQALFAQGGGTVLTYKDLTLGSTTYFCLTSHPEVYGA